VRVQPILPEIKEHGIFAMFFDFRQITTYASFGSKAGKTRKNAAPWLTSDSTQTRP